MKVRTHVFVSGRVQGVFFRSETRRKARQLKVTGWVRNLRDGRVEAIFEGDQENVEALVRFCRTGSYGASVTRIDAANETYSGEFQDFRVVW